MIEPPTIFLFDVIFRNPIYNDRCNCEVIALKLIVESELHFRLWLDLFPAWEDSPGEGNGNPLQYPCLEKSHGQRSLGAAVHGGHKDLDMTQQLTHLHNIL